MTIDYTCVCFSVKKVYMIVFVVVQMCDDSCVYASAIANKLIHVMDTSLAAGSLN